MKKPEPLEVDIQRQIIDFLEYNGCFVIRLSNAPVPLPNGGFRKVKQVGLPDLIVFIPPKKGLHAIPVFIEIKRNAKCKLSPDQERVLGDADLIGVKCIVACSLEFVQEQLKQYL